MPFSQGTELVVVYTNGKIVYISKGFEELFGFQMDEFKELMISGSSELYATDSFDRFRKQIKIGIQERQEILDFDTLLKNKKGDQVLGKGTIEFHYNLNSICHSMVFRGTFLYKNKRAYNDRELLEQRLEIRNNILTSISNLTYEILTAGDSAAVLSEAMRVVGHNLNVDRIYFFSLDQINNSVSQEIEWTYEDTSAQIKNPELQNVKLSDIGELSDRILKNEIFNSFVKDVKDPGLKETLELQEIKSLLIVPISQNEKTFGFIGLDNCHTERQWTEFEIQTLTTLANVFAGSFKIQSIQQALEVKKMELHTILDGLEDMVFTSDYYSMDLNFENTQFQLAKKLLAKGEKQTSSFLKFVAKEDSMKLKRFIRKVYSDGYAETKLRTVFDGNFQWIHFFTKIISNPLFEKPIVLNVIRDITKEYLAEQKAIEAIRTKQVAEKKVAELEVRTLQMQMNPHFIFNALNSIQSYIINNEPLEANEYLSNFSQLMRLFLDSSRHKYINIQNELKLIELYIQVEKSRFPKAFDYEIKIDPKINMRVEIPSMIIQPFIENAINHGLRYKKAKGHLNILLYKDNNSIVAQISDDGIGIEKSLEVQKKIKFGYKSQALKITEERIQIYNLNNKGQMSYTMERLDPSSEEPGLKVTVRFPSESDKNKI